MKKTPKVGRCNIYPSVWAAMYGCLGIGRFVGWQPPTTSNGRYSARYACAACQCGKALTDGLPAHAYQEALTQVQELAGVENYRRERTIMVDGRPCLEGREPLAPFSERWPLLRPMTITGWVSYNYGGEQHRSPVLEVSR